MNAILSKTIQTAVDATLDNVAAFLVKQNGLFAKKMTKAALLKILKSADTAKPAKAAKAGKKAETSEDCPEGWEKKSWTKFHEKLENLEEGKYLNVTTKMPNNGKKKTGLVFDETYPLCAKKGEEEALEAVVAFLAANGKGDDDESSADASVKGEESSESDTEHDVFGGDESEAPAKGDESEGSEKKDEESSKSDEKDEEDNDFIEGYDAKLLDALKKAIKKAAKDEFINVTSRRVVKQSKDNEKKFLFDPKRKIAIAKLSNEKEMKEFVKRVHKMLE